LLLSNLSQSFLSLFSLGFCYFGNRFSWSFGNVGILESPKWSSVRLLKKPRDQVLCSERLQTRKWYSKVQARRNQQRKQHKSKKAREITFGFISSFLDLNTISAKRQKYLHQGLQNKII
jgi:hypothetical protein